MALNPQIQLVKLGLVNAAGRIREQTLAFLGLRKRDNIPDIIRSGQKHHKSVQSEGDAAVRRSAEF